MIIMTVRGICFLVTVMGLHWNRFLIVVRGGGCVGPVVKVRLRPHRSLQGAQQRCQKDDGRSGG